MKLTHTLPLSTLLSTALAVGKQDPAPAEITIPETFIWRDPFSTPAILASYSPSCQQSSSFTASEYNLNDLYEAPPEGLWPWADALKRFFGTREYPGGWEGKDPHGYDRLVLKMEYEDVPVRVREWIEEEERSAGKGKGLYAVYAKPSGEWKKVESSATAPKTASRSVEEREEEDAGKVVIFSPGALYSNLPLWVAEGSGCETTFLDLENYVVEPKDSSVIAWVTEHKIPNRAKKQRDIEFTVKAQALKLNDAGKDEL